MAGLTVCVLGVVRCANPAVVGETVGVSSVPLDSSVQTVVSASKTESIDAVRKTGLHTPYSMPVFKEADGRPLKSKIYSVPVRTYVSRLAGCTYCSGSKMGRFSGGGSGRSRTEKG